MDFDNEASDGQAASTVSPGTPNLIDGIEKRTRRKVVIEDAECDAALAKCHPQDQCPLFNSFPREIRALIWVFSTAPYEAEQHRYAENEYYYRPGHTARWKTVSLLRLT